MNFKRFFLSLLILTSLIIFGCSNNEHRDIEIIYYGEGEHWAAQFTTTSTATEKENIVIDYFYKGKLSELLTPNDIVFSYGTTNGSISKTISFDNIDKTHYSVTFEGDFIHGDVNLVNIVENTDEKFMSMINWNGKSETLHLTQFVKKQMRERK